MKFLVPAILLITFSSLSWSQYWIYESPYNQINQTIIETSDGGYLIAAVEFCYTPEEWVIEGCPVGIHLIKTTAEGDTIWTNEIVNADQAGFIHVFENRDGTYTLFTG